MKLFEAFNQELLDSNLIKIDEQFLLKHNISFEIWDSYFKKYKLNSSNVYFYDKQIFSSIFYLGELVASELRMGKYLFSDLSILDDELLGLKGIALREDYFKKEFEAKNYSLIFSREYNPLSLNSFLKNYDKIDKDQLFDVFISCYQSISYGFNKIPKEILNHIFKYAPNSYETLCNLIDNEGLDSSLKIDDYITIYRGQGTKSSKLNDAKSWTLSIEVAKKFADYGEGHVYTANVKIKDLICYVYGAEHEVLVCFQNLINVKKMI